MTADTTGTVYHIFQEKDNAGAKTYEPVGARIEARSAAEALRQTAKTNGVYVAVPERSFRPVKVSVHTETTIKLG